MNYYIVINDLLVYIACILFVLGCCHRIWVNSTSTSAAFWRYEMMGLFTLHDSIHDRPVYKNKASDRFLFYYGDDDWWFGPDFQKDVGGIYVSPAYKCPGGYAILFRPERP